MTVWKALIALTAAAALTAVAGASALSADRDLDVVVTIKPIHSLVTRLMEGIGTPTLLIEGAASPHTFALKPSGVRAINNADVFVRVSASVEPFTRKIVKSLPAEVEVVTLMRTPGIALLERREGGAYDAHRHGAHEHEDEHLDSAHVDLDDMDGHIWLDPENAKAIVDYLAEVLAKKAPAHAQRLKDNAQRLKGDIDALQATLGAQMRPLTDKPFITFHDAYQYFEKRFGLNAVGSITVSPEVQPSAKRLTELRQKIRELGAVCVFAEPLFRPNLVEAVIEGTHVRSGKLDPSGSLLAPGGALYFKLMRDLGNGFETCLARPA